MQAEQARFLTNLGLDQVFCPLACEPYVDQPHTALYQTIHFGDGALLADQLRR